MDARADDRSVELMGLLDAGTTRCPINPSASGLTAEFFDLCFVFPTMSPETTAEIGVGHQTGSEDTIASPMDGATLITQSQMQHVLKSVLKRQRIKGRKSKVEHQAAQGGDEEVGVFSPHDGWKEGMTDKDLCESLQKSFIFYLNKKGCYIRQDITGDLTLYGVRMKESALKRIAQDTHFVLQMDSETAERYREAEDDGATDRKTSLHFIPPYLEYDMSVEGTEEKDKQRRGDISISMQLSSLGYSPHGVTSSPLRAPLSEGMSTGSSPSGHSQTSYSPMSGVASTTPKRLIWQRYDLAGRKVHVTLDTKNDKQTSIFRPTDRIKLLLECINQAFSLDHMQEHRVMETYYPLRQRPASDELYITWGYWANMVQLHRQPLNEIREYFGENIAFYFAWLGFTTQSLLMPALVGLGVFSVQCWFDPDGEFHHPISNLSAMAFAFYISLWAQLQMFEWNGVETRYRLEWGMDSRRRLQLESHRRSIGIGEQDDDRKSGQLCRRLVSILVSLMFVGFVLGVVSIVFSIPFLLRMYPEYSRFADSTDLPKYIAIVNVTFVKIFDVIWSKLADTLTRFEHRKYDENFQQSFIFKIFIFRLVNYFNSFYYIAFLKEYISPCLPDGCHGLLKWNVGMIILTTFLFNMVEMGTPYFYYLCSRFQAWRRGGFKEASEIRLLRRLSSSYLQEYDPDVPINECEIFEMPRYTKEEIGPDQTDGLQSFVKDYLLSSYDPVYGILEDHMETVLAFCFVTLLSLVLPLVPLLTYISNVFEIRSDGYKLLKLHRRPFPTSGHGIGPWKQTLKFTCYLSIGTNIAMCVFTMGLSQLTTLSFSDKLIIFTVTEHFAFLFPMLFQLITPDESKEVEEVKEEMEQVVQRALGNATRVLIDAKDR